VHQKNVCNLHATCLLFIVGQFQTKLKWPDIKFHENLAIIVFFTHTSGWTNGQTSVITFLKKLSNMELAAITVILERVIHVTVKNKFKLKFNGLFLML